MKKAAIVIAVVLTFSAVGMFANSEYQKKQEYEIYSIVLNKILSKHVTKMVVLRDQTSIGPISPYPIWNYLQARI